MPPSPFLERLGLEPRRPEKNLIGSRVEARRGGRWEGDPLREAMERALRAEEDRMAGKAASPYHGATGEPFLPESLSVSELEDLATCPFRFYVRHLLRPRGDREAEDGGWADLGAFLHRVIARVFRAALAEDKRKGKEVSALALGEGGLLEKAFSEVEAEWGRRPDSPFFLRRPDWPHRRGRFFRLLARAFGDGKGFLKEDAEILDVEVEVGAGKVFKGLVRGYDGLKVQGAIDRLELRSGSRFYLDYKLGSAFPRVKDPRTGELSTDLQLPLYILLHGKGRGAGVYYSLTTGKTKSAKRDLSALWVVFKEVRRALKNGAFPPHPDRKGEACRGCSAALLCRYAGR